MPLKTQFPNFISGTGHFSYLTVNRWVKLGKDLDLLDSPGMLPMRIDDQAAAIKLAICDDIGEKAYDFTDVAGILVQMLARIPEVGKFLNITIFCDLLFSLIFLR